MNPLIGLHATFGEIGAIAFLWVTVELLIPKERRIARARYASVVGFISIATSWLLGGYYYVVTYGDSIKPIIKGGQSPWVHSIITETKEHFFLFLPFLAFLTMIAVFKIPTKKETRILAGFVVLLAFLMAGMGFMISSGYREAIEQLIIQ